MNSSFLLRVVVRQLSWLKVQLGKHTKPHRWLNGWGCTVAEVMAILSVCFQQVWSDLAWFYFVWSCDMSLVDVAFYMVALLLSDDAGGLALVGAWVMLWCVLWVWICGCSPWWLCPTGHIVFVCTAHASPPPTTHALVSKLMCLLLLYVLICVCSL